MATIGIGMFGLGTVGAAVADYLRRNSEQISRRCGHKLELQKVCVRDVGRKRAIDLSGLELTDDPEQLFADKKIDVVVELAGGIDPAKQWLLRAFSDGRHVVTANKALLAEHGAELFAAACAAGTMLCYEAAVAGGVPVIKTLREAMAGNRIRSAIGIINGTCNSILTDMEGHGASFADALAKAQRLGYAEADPHLDVSGIDAAHKLALIAAVAFGMLPRFDKGQAEGVTTVEAEDIRYAKELGYSIRHIGVARDHGVEAGIEQRVYPALLPRQHPLAAVYGVLNAVLLQAEPVGELICEGPGAGAGATASAVLADLVDVARGAAVEPTQRPPALGFMQQHLQQLPLRPPSECHSAFYLRMQAANRPGVLAQISSVLAASNISMQAVLQKQPTADADTVPLVLMTHKAREGDVAEALESIAALDVITPPIQRLRVEGYDPC
ncbi:MAG: homoserine dehydrogenase [Candidatus Porifericomitaceae bacterium WSBS_2022_MAG_OTU9]